MESIRPTSPYRPRQRRLLRQSDRCKAVLYSLGTPCFSFLFLDCYDDCLQGFECPKNYNPADYFLGLISSDEDDDNDQQYAAIGSSRGNSTAEASALSHNGSTIESEYHNGSENHNNVDTEMIMTMMGGASFAPATRPSSNVNKLVKAFDESKENDALKKRIDFLKNSAVENPTESQVKLKRKHPIKITTSWCKEVHALFWVREDNICN